MISVHDDDATARTLSETHQHASSMAATLPGRSEERASAAEEAAAAEEHRWIENSY